MRHIKEFTDERIRGFCAYCGKLGETSDHVPPRIFLDKPYPSNLPVVSACRKCNIDVSMDEEYIACLLDCVISGSIEPTDIEREKIANILVRKPKLASRLKESSQVLLDNRTWFAIESDRIRKVVLKLAKGHAAFEWGEPRLEEPNSVLFIPLVQLKQEQIELFDSVLPTQFYPEVGSRGMQRVIEDGPCWIVAQPQRYRYLTINSTIVRFVIREYLACEVVW